MTRRPGCSLNALVTFGNGSGSRHRASHARAAAERELRGLQSVVVDRPGEESLLTCVRKIQNAAQRLAEPSGGADGVERIADLTDCSVAGFRLGGVTGRSARPMREPVAALLARWAIVGSVTLLAIETPGWKAASRIGRIVRPRTAQRGCALYTAARDASRLADGAIGSTLAVQAAVSADLRFGSAALLVVGAVVSCARRRGIQNGSVPVVAVGRVRPHADVGLAGSPNPSPSASR